MDFDKIACIRKCTVFINKGAGNLPKSSPSSVLLYLSRKMMVIVSNISGRAADVSQPEQTEIFNQRLIKGRDLQCQDCAESIPNKNKKQCLQHTHNINRAIGTW